MLAFFAAILVASSGAALLQSQTVHAQSWPSSWTWIDSDGNENGPLDDYRDVRDAYLSFDSEHLYLRMRLWGTPHFNDDARYKWLIDVGIAPNLYMPDNNILGSEYVLFVEDDNPDDGTGEVYLLPASPNDRYGDYEPGLYKDPPYGPVSDNTIAGYRFQTDGGNYYVDMYVKLSALGQSDAYGISLWWATDQENPNLEQGPSTDTADAPFTITSPPPGPTPRGVAAYPSIYIGMGSALGAGLLAYLMRRRVAPQQV